MRSPVDVDAEVRSQLSLLPTDRRNVLVVIGHKCAGKSTFSAISWRATLRCICARGEYDLTTNRIGRRHHDRRFKGALRFLEKRNWDVVARRAPNISHAKMHTLTS